MSYTLTVSGDRVANTTHYELARMICTEILHEEIVTITNQETRKVVQVFMYGRQKYENYHPERKQNYRLKDGE
jgi:hypothetical protein